MADENNHGLHRLCKLMQNIGSSGDRATRNTPQNARRFSFDPHLLLQARQELDNLLTQTSLNSHKTASRKNQLTEGLVRRYFEVSRNFAENVFEHKELMEVLLSIAVVYASQSKTHPDLLEMGFDLILEWLRHTKLDSEDKELIGSRVLPRILEQSFDNLAIASSKRKILLTIVELVNDSPKNLEILNSKWSKLEKLFGQSQDFISRYCCLVLVSMKGKSEQISGTSARKSWGRGIFSHKLSPQELSEKSPVDLMKILLTWDEEQRKQPLWNHKITKMAIRGKTYTFAAGPSFDEHYLTGMIQESSKSAVVLLDVKLDCLIKISVDRSELILAFHVAQGTAGAWLDFREMWGEIDLQLKDDRAMKDALQLLPHNLTEISETQLLSQTTYVHGYLSRGHSGGKQGKGGEMDTSYQPTEALQHFAGLQQLESSELSDISSKSTSSPDPVSKAVPAKSNSNSKVYRAKNGRYPRKRLRDTKAAPRNVQSEQKFASTRTSENSDKSGGTNNLGNEELPQGEQIDYNSPPPLSPASCLTRPPKRFDVGPPTRKRFKLDSDDEYQPSQKRIKSLATTKSIAASVPQKKANQPPKQAPRRRSAPHKTLNYVQQDGEETVEDTEGESKAADKNGKAASTSNNKKAAHLRPALDVLSRSEMRGDSGNTAIIAGRNLSTSIKKYSSEGTHTEELCGRDRGQEDVLKEDNPLFHESNNAVFKSPEPRFATRQEDDDKPSRPSHKVSNDDVPGPTLHRHLNAKDPVTFSSNHSMSRKSPISISVPCQGKSHVSNRPQGTRRSMTKLDALLEDNIAPQVDVPPVKPFQLARIHPDDDHEDDDDEDHSPSNASSSPSPSMANNHLVTRRNGLLLRDGKIQLATGMRVLGNGVNKKVSPLISTSEKINELTGPSDSSNNKENPQNSELKIIKRTKCPKLGDAMERFRAKLAGKGINFSKSEPEEDEDTSLSEYSSDSEQSDEGCNDSMEVIPIKPQPVLPTHQQSVRDSLAEITEAMFHKLLRSEAEEMTFLKRIHQEYELIFDTLVDSLNELMGAINKGLDRDETALRKRWKSARAAGIKASDALATRFHRGDDAVFTDFSVLVEKWR